MWSSALKSLTAKVPGFAELHIRSARIGEGSDGWAPRAAPAIRETVFGHNAGYERATITSHAPLTRCVTAPESTATANASSGSSGKPASGAVAPVFGAGEGETGRAAGRRDPFGGDARQALTLKTGMPSSRALSTRFSVMPAPGKATRPVGRSFSIWSLRRKGAARPWAFQSGRNTT